MSNFSPIFKVVKKTKNNYELHVLFTTKALCIPNIKSLNEIKKIKLDLIEKYSIIDMNQVLSKVLTSPINYDYLKYA